MPLNDKVAAATAAHRGLNGKAPLIVQVLCDQAAIHGLKPSEWDLLVRQGRSSWLLGRLAWTLQKTGLLGHVPLQARHHLKSALSMVQRQNSALQWEVRCLLLETSNANVPLTLLKGAAYAVLNLQAAGGRAFSDIDIIVPKAAIGTVESELMLHGWQNGDLDPWDERYYRQWMHEIPPLAHITRGTTIDVHHTILPETAKIRVNTAALFASMEPIAGLDGVQTLSCLDMVLHSATHLFHEGELEKGLRDLFDIDSLLREFSDTNPAFWSALAARARELGLQRPLFYALRYCQGLLQTSIPEELMRLVSVDAPSRLTLHIMDWCYVRALRPSHPASRLPGNWLARFTLYVRSHWIRMPAHLLVIHLGRKLWMRVTESAPSPNIEPAKDKPNVPRPDGLSHQ